MNDNNYAAIGNHIKAYRNANGYTQQQLADKLGIKRANLAKIETNANHGSLDILVKISRLLEISLDTLLGLDD